MVVTDVVRIHSGALLTRRCHSDDQNASNTVIVICH